MGMATKLLMASVLLSLSACENAAFDNSMRKAVREKLKDPDSAKWGEVHTYKSHACLEVNSKNSYGGYTGKQVAWLHTYDGGQSWSLDKIEEGVCYEEPLKELEGIAEAEKVAEKEMLALLATKGYKVTATDLLMLKEDDPSVDKCLLQAQLALTSKRIALSAKGSERAEWERIFENRMEPLISGSCKG